MVIEQAGVTANGVEFGYLHCGSGPLALCLHGFPDSAHTWRHLLPMLADAGFHAVAPFMRGYAPTAVPVDGRYQTGVLGLDAIALHDALGGGQPGVVIGHDWGATATYAAAVYEPDRWTHVVGMAVPPSGVLVTAFVTNLDQLQRSWYMFVFQHPLADIVVSAGDLAFVDRLWAQWSPGFDATEELALLKPSLRDPANAAAALGYYRAALSGTGVDPGLAAVQAAGQQVPAQPLLYLHGTDDGAIGVEVARASVPFLPASARLTVVEGTGHFLHLERPDVVNRAILEFVSS
jgi:pimeloyl-ACP methyl ester carboxylesterase